MKEALLEADGNKMSLDEIFDYVRECYPKKTDLPRWEQSLRRTIRRNDYFIGDKSNMTLGKTVLRLISGHNDLKLERNGNMEKPDYEDKLPVKVELNAISENDFDLNEDVLIEVSTRKEKKKGDPIPSECHKCGKDLRDLNAPLNHIKRCGKGQGKSGPMCPKCGKQFPYGTRNGRLQGLNSIEFQQNVQQGFQQSTLHLVVLNALLKVPLNSLLKFI